MLYYFNQVITKLLSLHTMKKKKHKEKFFINATICLVKHISPKFLLLHCGK